VKYAQCVKIWLFLKCAVSEVLYSVSYGHYIESGNCTISDEEKGRRAIATCLSYLGKGRHMLDTRISHRKQREARYIGARLPFT
jgi:hypothetical protein